MALGISDPSVTSPATYLDHVTYFIGGTSASPTAPRPATTLRTGMGRVFTVDMSGSVLYFVDSSGNLMLASLTNLSASPVQLLSQAQIGDTLTWLEIALDGSALYAIGAANKIYKVLTSAPYTVSVLAGSGADGTADGTGSAATFHALHTLYLDQATGLLLYTFDNSTGSLRSINVSSGAVVTIQSGIGIDPGNLLVSKDGTIYVLSNESMVTWSSTKGLHGIPLISGNYTNPGAMDDGEPGSYFLYFLHGSNDSQFMSVKRCELASGSIVEVATLSTSAGSSNYNDHSRMIYRTPALYLVDRSCNLLQIQG